MRRHARAAGVVRPWPKWLARARQMRARVSLTAEGLEALRREIAEAYRESDAKAVLVTGSEARLHHLGAEHVREYGDLPGEIDDVIEDTLRLIGAAS